MNILKVNNIVVETFEIKERINKFGKISKDYIYNNNKKITASDYIDFECPVCNKITHQNVQKTLFKNKFICRSCSVSKTLETDREIVDLGHISSIKRLYHEDQVIEVSDALLQEYISRNGEKLKRIKINNQVVVKNDYIEFECNECHQLKKQQIRSNRPHLFSITPICGECAYNKNIQEKYGVDNVWKSDIVKEKIKQTNIEKYGAKNVFCNDSNIKSKIRDIIFEKYGVYHNFENGILREKIKQTNIERYGVPYYVQSDKFKEQMSEFEHATYSKEEKEVADYIKSLNIEIKENVYDIISPLELDIYIPSKNLAIEYDGLYWHSNLYKDSEYHLNKTLECEKKGIRLIHIFEDEWINKQDIVKARLRNLLGKNSRRIGARKCEVREIDSKVKNEFLSMYHIQGKDSSSIKLGAYFENELIGVMTFGKGRKFTNNKSEEGKYELIRFATVSDTWTPGLASKMLQYFIRNYHPQNIYSYADRRWSQGKVYESIGFKFEHFTGINYWYFNEIKRLNRFGFRKSELKHLFPDIYSDDKTEFEIMDETEYLRIFDCGNIKYVLEVHN